MKDRVLILGTSDCALKTAELLSDSGYGIHLVSRENADAAQSGSRVPCHLNGKIRDHYNTTLLACRGEVGQFEMDFMANGKRFTLQAVAVVIAEDSVPKANLAGLGLQPAENILPLSHIEQARPDRFFLNPVQNKQIAFVFGMTGEGQPSAFARMLAHALSLQKKQARCYVVAGNLKVAGPGLGEKCREAQSEGVVFFKPKTPINSFGMTDEGKPVISFVDPSIRQAIELIPDFAVVDETVTPAPYLAHLASIMGLETDDLGYIQSDNVHRLPVGTNRSGILAIGPSRGPHDSWNDAVEAKNGHLAVHKITGEHSDIARIHPEINTDRCIRCLTCLRLCPHHAVVHRHHRLEVTSGCEGCWMCIAACPRQAIETAITPDQDNINFPEKTRDSIAIQDRSLNLTIFGCDRSATPAIQMAKMTQGLLPASIQWVKLPCAGAIKKSQMLSAFTTGSDGILVLTCHSGNCHSGYGEQIARQQVSETQQAMEDIGLNPKCLAVFPLAANMGCDFIRQVNTFINDLKALCFL